MYFFTKKILYILAILVFTGIIAGESSITFARWANYNDAASEIEHTKRTIYINKDGTSSEIYEIQAKILKDNAKSSWAKYAYGYNAYERSVKILEAYTLTNGQKYIVNPRKIKKQSIPQALQTLNEETEIIVPYPKLKIGSSVYLKAKFTDFIPTIGNCHYNYFSFGDQFYTRSSSAHIISELPLHISIHDPDKALNIKESKKTEKNKIFYCLDMHQTKPIYKHIVNEDNIHFNLKHVPVVSIAAMPTRAHYGKAVAAEYTKIKNQALPALYQDIANVANKKYNNIEKINTITYLLHKNIKYLINPKYGLLPQPLQKTADTGHGDCKDFSVATCAILQAIGISAKVVFVRQGDTIFPFPSSLPAIGTNHAIVKVELPEGPLWLDPTDKTATANYIPPHITNRKAFVLHEDYATDEEYIPCTKPEDCRLIKRETWDMKDAPLIHIKGTIEILGSATRPFTSIKNTSSEDEIKDLLLVSVIKNENEIINYDIKLPNLKSDTIEDLFVDYTMTVKSPQTKNNNAMPLSIKSARLLMAKKDTVSALYLGPIRIYDTYITLQNMSSFDEKDFNYHVESPWANLSRSVNYDKANHQVLIHKKIEVKKNWIEDTEFTSDAYRQLQLSLSKNY